jgi:hypothetical protein
MQIKAAATVDGIDLAYGYLYAADKEKGSAIVGL